MLRQPHKFVSVAAGPRLARCDPPVMVSPLPRGPTLLLGGGLLLLFAVFDAAAHHSRATFYDSSQVVEAEGVITRVIWRNPHTRFWLEDDQGNNWALETTPPAMLSRRGVEPEVLTVGTRVRVAGPPARFVANAMEVSNLLLPDGGEVRIQPGAEPRWSEDAPALAAPKFAEADVRAAEAAATGIFRVWSRDVGIRLVLENGYPLTEAAQAARDGYDPVADNPIPGCTPKGMPMIMTNPYPFEFVDRQDEIHLRIEEYDLVRVIHMAPAPDAARPSPLGYSVGRWENGDLVVTTTHIDFMHFGSGIALSANVELLERFAMNGEQTRLDYTLTVTDPETFTEPLTGRRNWIWVPGEAVEPWECFVESDPTGC